MPHVVELLIPGTWLHGLAPDVGRDAEALLQLMITSIEDAGLALTLFESSQSSPLEQDPRRRWELERDEEAAIQAELLRTPPADLDTEPRLSSILELHDLARREAKRRRWAAGELPDSYRHRLPFLHAKSYVYALDTIGKALRQLLDLPGVPDLTEAMDLWNGRFPDLRHVRDSAHHPEDRVRGQRHGKALETHPVINSAIHAPNGGVLIIDMLNNDRYGGTLGNGHYGEVEVSAESLHAVGGIVQQVVSSFSWTGPPGHRPH